MSNSLLWIIDDTDMHLSDRLDSEPTSAMTGVDFTRYG